MRTVTARHPSAAARDPVRRFVALGHDFSLTCHPRPLERYLVGLLAPFAVAGHAASAYELCVDPGGVSSAWFDGEPLVETSDAAHVVATFLWHVNQEVVRRTTDRLLLHAGVIAVDGRAVVLPAGMEAGKTTLVTALVQAGADYLSDELAAVHPLSLEVSAYPKALSLDPGSWSLFPRLVPDLDPSLRSVLPHQWQVPADAIRAGAVCDSAQVAAVVLPTYQPAQLTSLERLEPADAIRELAGCSFGFRDRPQPSLEAIGRLVASVPVSRLTVSDLSHAIGLVLGSLEDTRIGGAVACR